MQLMMLAGTMQSHRDQRHHNKQHSGALKLEFHDADIDTDTNILARMSVSWNANLSECNHARLIRMPPHGVSHTGIAPLI